MNTGKKLIGAIAVFCLSATIMICSPKKTYVDLNIIEQYTWILPNSLAGQDQNKQFSAYVINSKEEYQKRIEPYRKVISSRHFHKFDNLDMSKYCILLISSSTPYFGIDNVRNQFTDTLYVTLGKTDISTQKSTRTYTLVCIAGKLYNRTTIVFDKSKVNK